MRFILTPIFLCLFIATITGQGLVISPTTTDLCQPGVINKSPSKGILFQQEFSPLTSQGGVISSNTSFEQVNRRFTMKLKAPIVAKRELKIIAGWNFIGETFRPTTANDAELLKPGSGDTDDILLKSSRLTLSVLKPLNSRLYLAIKGQAAFNGNFDGMFNFDQKYANYNLIALLGIKRSPRTEWGIGGLYRYGESIPVLPVGIFNHTFNRKWGIEAVLPTKIKLRYNVDQENIFLFGPELEFQSYFIDRTNAQDVTVRRTDLRFEMSYQRYLGRWFWFELAGGYIHNLSSKFEYDQVDTDFSWEQGNNQSRPYLKAGLFISPTQILKKRR